MQFVITPAITTTQLPTASLPKLPKSVRHRKPSVGWASLADTASMSVIAFHQKASRSQVGSGCFYSARFSLGQVASVATLPCALLVSDHSLGASWAFSLQPVLPPDYRPALPPHRWKVGPVFNASLKLGVWVLLFPSQQCFAPGSRASLSGRSCATVGTLLRLPQLMQQHG